MSLAYLAPLYQELDVPAADRGLFSSTGLTQASRPVAIAALANTSKRPVLVIAPRADVANRMNSALRTLLPDSTPVLSWDSPDPLPYEQLPHDPDLSNSRVDVLDQIRNSTHAGSVVIVTTIRALLSYIRSFESFERDLVEVRTGQRLDDQLFVRRLVAAGYHLEPVTDVPGTLSRRGGIIDVFSPGSSYAARIEFFGDEVDSIRHFDPLTQRSTERVDEVRLLPPIEFDLRDQQVGLERLRALDLDSLRPEVADEWLELFSRLEVGAIPEAIDLLAVEYPGNQSTLLDYLQPSTVIVEVEPRTIALEAEQIELRALEVRGALEASGEIPAGLVRPYAQFETLFDLMQSSMRWQIGASESGSSEVRVRESFIDPPLFAGNIDALIDDLGHRIRQGWRIILATDQSERIHDLLAEHDIYPRVARRSANGLAEPPLPGSIDVIHASLESGFGIQASLTLVLTDHELFGIRKTIRPPAQKRRIRHRPAREFDDGGYVVHVEHGVGIFRGLTTLNTSGIDREYLRVDYVDGDKLYVPTDQSDRLTPYESPAGSPRITRLSSAEWTRTKARVKQAVREMAYELLEVYAARELATAHAFPSDTAWDIELAESFPFQETVDQQAAINDVTLNLESTRPMDRLVCGDVGYGKTEVALRSAFKVVNDGWQVALLVPTTVLALQHFETFRDRLAAFPVNVEMLSRLRNRAEQREILKGLAAGTVDIVIGTHRLVQRDVKFSRLGLLVVDEEQRFGVRHKEYIKRQRAEIDVLTMTATPIPRTLYMSLTGLRDLSLISTPPQERVPIRTFVTGRNDTVVREAILREMSRGGQIYVVHNRVHSIYQVRRWLEELVPEASLGVGHGQMDEKELEQVILSFMSHEFDVLICTTIIESGIDIQNANTIIIDNAHALGLTQLYQLRGRVGRGSVRAYAYLLYPERQPLSGEARQRLAAIQEATELGAGFQIAMRDMEIRGAGNILGAQQSGHITAVGLDLYTRMLATAVEEIRAGTPIIEPDEVNIDIAVDSRIPSEYIADENLRLSMYHRIASSTTAQELGEIRAELRDRFGEPPDQVEQVFDLIRLRHRAQHLGVTTIVERGGEILVRPVIGARLDQRLLRKRLGPGVRITPNQIRIQLGSVTVERWQAIEQVLDAVERIRDSILVS